MKRLEVILVILFLILSIILNYKTSKEIEVLKAEIADLEEKEIIILEKRDAYKELISSYEVLEECLYDYIEALQEENEGLRIIRAKLTAYSPLDNVDGQQAMGDPNRTSRGYPVGRRIAAVDPKKIPYGTILDIPEYGIVECQDTGGALRRDNKNIRIDLYHDTYKEALSFGVQDKDIKILKWGEE